MSDLYSQHSFQGYKDYFNDSHFSIYNVIECIFGVLKECFKILSLIPAYSIGRQGLIVTTCCMLHNFIRRMTSNDQIFERWSNMQLPKNALGVGDEAGSCCHPNITIESGQAIAAKRDEITIPMWAVRDGH